MQSIWSVSQYENEYNPQHNHSHCQISAVLYLKIPEMRPRNIPNKPKEKDGQIEFTFCTNDSIFTTGSFVVRPKPGTCNYYFLIVYIIKYIHFKVLVKEEVLHSTCHFKDLVNQVEYNHWR